MDRTYQESSEVRIAYHVAGDGWQQGEPIYTYDDLMDMGCAPEWKWEDAPAGYDGDIVCMFESLDEAVDFQSEFGGQIVKIEVWEDEWTMGRNDEGYLYKSGAVPTEAIIGTIE